MVPNAALRFKPADKNGNRPVEVKADVPAWVVWARATACRPPQPKAKAKATPRQTNLGNGISSSTATKSSRSASNRHHRQPQHRRSGGGELKDGDQGRRRRNADRATNPSSVGMRMF